MPQFWQNSRESASIFIKFLYFHTCKPSGRLLRTERPLKKLSDKTLLVRQQHPVIVNKPRS